jgi:hypothetical protein
MNRDFKGVWIPKELYLNEELSWTEKILLVEIHSIDKGEGCWAGNEHLAKFVGISISRLTDILTQLRKLGYIVDRSFDGRKRFLSANIPGLENKSQEGRVPENRKVGFLKTGRYNDEKSSFDGAVEPDNEDSMNPSNTVSNTINITELRNSEKKRNIIKTNIEEEESYFGPKNPPKRVAVSPLAREFAKVLKKHAPYGKISLKKAEEYVGMFREVLIGNGHKEPTDKFMVKEFAGFLNAIISKSEWEEKHITNFSYLINNIGKHVKML